MLFRRFRLRRVSPLYAIFALILAAALALGRYSYSNARLLANQSERSLSDTNRVLGEQTLRRVDNFIIDSDRALLDIVDLEHLGDFARRWTEIVRLAQPIEAAIVLDQNQKIVRGGYVSKSRGDEAEEFRKLFVSRILPELELDQLTLNLHKHLHTVVDGQDYLISYMKREQHATEEHPARVYYVCLKISLDYLLGEFFPLAFATLDGRELFAVVDDRDQVVYGRRVRAPRSLLYEEYFPTTLYLWRLQMAPPDAERLAAEAHKRRLYDTTLIAFMVTAILGGIAFLLYAVRKERRANQLKSDFISNVSHELKTPLSLIRMFGELLSLGRVRSPETAREYAGIITRESEHLTRLLDNVLDFSRIERGQAAFDLQTGDLADVVLRALDVHRHRYAREGVTLGFAVEDDLPAARFDESAMTLVILNLLDNAMKYGGERGRIEVGLRREGEQLRLSIADHGPGIPLDEQRRIFERFYRARAAREQNARGSGIGLSLVKHIVEAHDGRVTVQSEHGHGAEFVVLLPLAPPDPASEKVA